MVRCTTKELLDNAKLLAEAYIRGDDPCCGIPRSEVFLLSREFAVYAPYIPLQITPIVGEEK